MKITTPTATLGIRGTTGLVEVPEGAAANNPNNVAIKLYPDADGKVVASRSMTAPAPGSASSPRAPAALRFAPARAACASRGAADDIAAADAARSGLVRQVHSTQNLGRRVSTSSATSAAPIPPSTVSTRRAADAAKRIAGKNAPARRAKSSGQPQPGQQNRPGQQQQPGSQTVPDNNCRTDRVSRSNRARLTGRANSAAAGISGSPQQTGLPPRPGQPP